MKMVTTLKLVAASAVLAASQSSFAALTNYSQDFEGVTLLGSDGWSNFINNGIGVYDFPLDGASQVATVVSGEGGAAQGNDHLNIFSNYDDAAHNTNNVDVSVFQTQTTSLSNVGQTWRFSYDAKAPSVAGGSAGGTPAIDPGSGATAEAFIKGFGPNFAFFFPIYNEDQTLVGADDWTSFSHDLTLTTVNPGDWDNWVIQFGFGNVATGYADTGVLYDNVSFELVTSEVPIPAAAWLFGSALMGLVGMSRRRKS